MACDFGVAGHPANISENALTITACRQEEGSHPPQRHPNNSLPTHLHSDQLPSQRHVTQFVTSKLLCSGLHVLRHQPRDARASFPRLAHSTACKHTIVLESQEHATPPLDHAEAPSGYTAKPSRSSPGYPSLVCTRKKLSQ
jgi:hypothetical protein